MISSIDIGDTTGDIAGEIADKAHRNPADVFDADEPPLWRSFPSFVDQLVEMIDA